MGQIPCSLEKTYTVVIMLPFVGHLPRNMGLDYLDLHSSYRSCCVTFTVLTVKGFSLLVFWSFSSISTLQIFAILIFPWKEVSLGSSYSAISATPQAFVIFHKTVSLYIKKRWEDLLFLKIQSLYRLIIGTSIAAILKIRIFFFQLQFYSSIIQRLYAPILINGFKIGEGTNHTVLSSQCK